MTETAKHSPYSDAALLILGHGSTENPDSSEPTWQQAERIRQRGLFREVHCAFWKEEPGFRIVEYAIESAEVFVVPNFISEGYFTREVIPRELGLTGRTTGVNGKTWHYCDPIGIHPNMTQLLLNRTKEVAPDVPPEETAVIIVGHGTGLNTKSIEAIQAQVKLLRDGGYGYAEVIDAYMEQEPLVEQWDELCHSPHVVVVPFFVADGLHSFQDIPVLLGLSEELPEAASQTDIFRQNPVELRGRKLYYSRAVGTDDSLADVILDQVGDFAASEGIIARVNPAAAEGLLLALTDRLKQGPLEIGEVLLRALPSGSWEVRHADDGDLPEERLETHVSAEAAIDLGKFSEEGAYRPLKWAPTLKRGWQIVVGSLEEACRALEG
ncbi:MAG: CbiX/SirB N-terminal domain-containing protein, partial [Verrucomicrobiota bacterium]